MKYAFLIMTIQFFAGSVMAAESWTNMAGQVLAADLVSVNNQVAVFKEKQGRVRQYRLSLFSRSEQQRILKAVGCYQIPAALKAENQSVTLRLKHVRSLYKAGIIDDDGYRKRKTAALSLFEIRARRWYKKKKLPIDESLIAEMIRELNGE